VYRYLNQVFIAEVTINVQNILLQPQYTLCRTCKWRMWLISVDYDCPLEGCCIKIMIQPYISCTLL